MNCKFNLFKTIAIATLIFTLDGCKSGDLSLEVEEENMINFSAAFTQQEWDGATIPSGQQCNRQGGNGSTPELRINNIPATSNALVFEYSDGSVAFMDHGGHGIIQYALTSGVKSTIIPSVSGHTFDLPDGFTSTAAHRVWFFDTAGAYLPPCSGGSGNRYYVKIKAVRNATGQAQELLTETTLELGKY